MTKVSVLPVLLLVIFASCSKKPKETFKGCLVTQVKAAGVVPQGTILNVFRLEYNDEGALTKVAITATNNGVASDSVRRFRYGNGYVVADHFKGNPGEPDHRDSMVLDKDNRIIAVYTAANGQAMKLLESMTYDAEGQLRQISSGATWDWAKGDVIMQRTGNDTATFGYYATAYNTGAIQASYDDLVRYGRPLKKRTRMLKSSKYPQHVYEHAHQLDAEGKVVKAYERSLDGLYDWTYEYAYDCR